MKYPIFVVRMLSLQEHPLCRVWQNTGMVKSRILSRFKWWKRWWRKETLNITEMEKELGAGMTRAIIILDRLKWWKRWWRKETLNVTETEDALMLHVVIALAFHQRKCDSLCDTAYVDPHAEWGVKIVKNILPVVCHGPFTLPWSPIYDVEIGAVGGLGGIDARISREQYARAYHAQPWERTSYDLSPGEAEVLKDGIVSRLIERIGRHGANLPRPRCWLAAWIARKLARARRTE